MEERRKTKRGRPRPKAGTLFWMFWVLGLILWVYRIQQQDSFLSLVAGLGIGVLFFIVGYRLWGWPLIKRER